ncbi:CPBP family glutamic-type intramembrane protease [Nocardiopsis halophila]|uniref:CPBP family glutamic-type intramembrane protease n=1 Tax=Nocardiopsis halophila TaxID=141692 RepID=UPI000344FD57|nr:CPBP family glutamic-type intramembrane protease [Nocardiopsis halophila]
MRTVLCAAAEEALWRLAALGGLVQAGVPAAPAAALSLVGFALLHVPRNGWRVLPYQLVFGAVLTVLALAGGLLAAVLCHGVHNLVMGATARRPRPPAPGGPAAPAGLPPSRSWGG